LFVLAASLLSGFALGANRTSGKASGTAAAPQQNFTVGRHGSVHVMLTRSGAAAAVAANKAAGTIRTAFPHTLLPYNGGPVMHSSHVYTIYWLPAGYDYGDPVSTANYESLINGFFTNLSGTSFYDILTQYPDTTNPLTHTNTLGGSYVDTTAYPCGSTCGDVNTSGHFLTDADIQNEVLRATHANSWQPGLTNQYMVFYGNGVQSCFDSSGPASGCSGTDYCAYHGQFSGNNGSVNGQWVYSNMWDAGTAPQCSLGQPSPNGDAVADQEISPTSHEMSESITDPDPLGQAQGQAWQNAAPGPSGFGGEIGDLCAYVWKGLTNLNGTNYAIQSEWSNYDADCVTGDSIPTTVEYTGPTSANAGATVTLTATLKDGNNAGVGSQSVKITVGSQSCTALTDFAVPGTSLGHASCQITLNQPAGGYNVQAQYLGGIGAYQASNSATGTFTIGQQATTMSLTCTPNPQQFGQPVTCTATVIPASSGTPTGNVAFTDNSATIPGCGAKALNQGNPDKAVCTFTPGTLGSNSIVATYGGDANYTGSSATFTLSVTGGTIRVIQHLISSPIDPATFNLLIDGTTYAVNVGNGGTTGAVPVPTGSHTVSETAGLFTNMGNYTTRIACSNGAAGYGTSLSGITVNNGNAIICTITNTRKLFKP
jgi:hypothetical protein